jgi:hypothetical protein
MLTANRRCSQAQQKARAVRGLNILGDPTSSKARESELLLPSNQRSVGKAEDDQRKR